MITDELRAWLRAVADELIPAADGMPSAGAVGVADQQLDLVLAARPDLLRQLLRAFARTGELAGAAAFAALGELDPDAQGALAQIVAGGYYASATVRELIGYVGQQPIPVRPQDFPEYISEGLLERVVARGPVHRSVD